MFIKLFNNKNIIFYDQLFVSFSNFLIIILIQKIAGLYTLGLFTYIWTFALIIFSIQNALILSPNFTEIKFLDKETSSQQISSIIIFQFIFFLFIYIFSWIFLRYFFTDFFNELNLSYNFIFFSIFFFNFFGVLKKILYSLNKSLEVLVADFITYLFFFIFFYFLKKNISNNIETIFILYMLSFLTGTLFLLKSFIKIFKIHKKFYLSLIRLIKLGYPLLSAQVFQFFSGNYWILCLGSIYGFTTVGVVRSITNIIQYSNIFFQFFENFYPNHWSSKYINSGIVVLNNELKHFLIFYFTIISTISLFLFIFSNEILNIIYNNTLLEYENFFKILLFLPLFQLIKFPFQFALRVLKKNIHISYAYFLGAFFSLLTAKYLIENFNIYGFIVGSYVLNILPAIYMSIVYYKKNNL